MYPRLDLPQFRLQIWDSELTHEKAEGALSPPWRSGDRSLPPLPGLVFVATELPRLTPWANDLSPLAGARLRFPQTEANFATPLNCSLVLPIPATYI